MRHRRGRALRRRYGHAAKWVQAIKDRLAANPLYYKKNPDTECVCQRCSTEKGIPHGKKVPLYAVTNYGREFDHCYACGTRYG